jgi:hypothetical protein
LFHQCAKIVFMFRSIPTLLLSTLLLAGCDQVTQRLGLEAPGKKEAQMEAEGKAVGSACRHSGRAIEDCYAIYSWLPKAAVYAGWREMDAYMRENKLDTVTPQLPPPEPPSTGKKKRPATAANADAVPVEAAPTKDPSPPEAGAKQAAPEEKGTKK